MWVEDLVKTKALLKERECPVGSAKTFEAVLEAVFAQGSKLGSALGCTVESQWDWVVSKNQVKKLERKWLWVWESTWETLKEQPMRVVVWALVAAAWGRAPERLLKAKEHKCQRIGDSCGNLLQLPSLKVHLRQLKLL